MNTHNFKLLIVDDDTDYTKVLTKILSTENYAIQTANSGEDAFFKVQLAHYDLVLTDLMMSGMNGIELLEKIKKESPLTEVILITGFGTVENAVEAMRKGAYSYFIKGNDPDELLMTISKIVQSTFIKKQNSVLIDTLGKKSIELTSKNLKFQKTIELAKKAAYSNASILLLGESGVGKEVFARYIHQHSQRKNAPFIPVNCHAFQETMLESELFGHKKGAFTGAQEDRIGRFEAADHGTLFLDEIADTPMNTQTKLLRAIENKTIERIGSNEGIYCDFRLISATNKSIDEMISNQTFREDFYYRISTIIINIPPLRERKEDIPQLVDYFIEELFTEMKCIYRGMDEEVYDMLMTYDYPGNVRELKNIIERLAVLSMGGWISKEDVQLRPTKKSLGDVSLKDYRAHAEKSYIQQVLEENNYNMTQSAQKLGISRRQLFNKVTEYNLKDE
ncbi:MAG: sigma-54-dependent Fis family transcriptional regulator [Clostridia bacterium]|nr:sigma-54-dependent Fis family transcriptional regulator [Clostridia bacterium]